MWAFPDELPVLCDFGGAGAGRTNGAFALAFRYLQRFPRARALYVRQIYNALKPAYDEAIVMAQRLHIRVKENRTELTLTLPNGSVLEMGPLEDAAYFRSRYLGQSFQFLILDELATWVDLTLPLMLFARLRHTSYPTRAVLLSNPGPSGHVLHKQLIAQRTPGVPYRSDFLGGKETVVLLSTARDNEFLNLHDYWANLRAASPSEAHFQRMAAGNFQAVESSLHVITAAHAVVWPRFDPRAYPAWKFEVGYDHGSVSPFAAVWAAKAQRDALGPDGTEYPAGSYVAFWESTSADPASAYTKAIATVTVEDIAHALRADAELLGFARVPPLKADDAVSQRTGTNPVLSEFKKFGIDMRPAGKGRVKNSIARINALLRNAAPATPTAATPLFRGAAYRLLPALFLTQDVPYLRLALENAASDPRDVDALSPKFVLKHVWDALAYLLTDSTPDAAPTTVQPMFGEDSERAARAALLQREQDRRARLGAGRGWAARVQLGS